MGLEGATLDSATSLSKCNEGYQCQMAIYCFLKWHNH